MFWKILRWGATVVAILITVAAAKLSLGSHSETMQGDSGQAQPEVPTSNKTFNA